MFFALAALALTAFMGIADATSLSSLSTSVKHDSKQVTAAAQFPVHDLDSVVAEPGRTLGTDRVRIDVADQEFPATLLLCPSANCASCFAFDLSTLPHQACLTDTSSTFTSVAIVQPSGEGLPFAVGVGPARCTSLASIPTVNECFNTNSVFSTFALVP